MLLNQIYMTSKINLAFIISIAFTLTGCHTAIQYNTLKTQGQNVDELNDLIETKEVLLIHYYDFAEKEFVAPLELKDAIITDTIISGMLTAPKTSLNKKNKEMFYVSKEYHNNLSEMTDTNFVNPAKALHIYCFSKPEDEGPVSIDRSKILSYDTHKMITQYRYYVDKKPMKSPWAQVVEDAINEDKVIVVESDNNDLRILSMPNIKDAKLEGEIIETDKIDYLNGLSSFNFPPNEIWLEQNNQNPDSLIHPFTVLHIQTTRPSLLNGSATFREEDITKYYTYKRSSLTKAEKSSVVAIGIVSAAIPVALFTVWFLANTIL